MNNKVVDLTKRIFILPQWQDINKPIKLVKFLRKTKEVKNNESN